MQTYAMLRDLGRQHTAGPFEAAISAREAGPGEPQIEVGRLDKAEVCDLVRDPQVRAVAPVMPGHPGPSGGRAGTGAARVSSVRLGRQRMPYSKPARWYSVTARVPEWTVTCSRRIVIADDDTRRGCIAVREVRFFRQFERRFPQ